MSNYLIFAWIGSFAYGLSVIAGKLTTKHQIKNSWQSSFFYSFLGLIVMIPLALLNGVVMPNKWGWIIAAGIVFAVSRLLYMLSLKLLDVSVLSPLFNFRMIFTILLGLLILKEPVSLNELLLMSLIVVAGFFAAYNEKFKLRAFFTPQVGVGLMFMAFMALYSLLINKAVAQTNYWTASLFNYLLSTILLFTFTFHKFRQDFKQTPVAIYSGVFIMAVLGMIGLLASNKAFSINLSISSIINALPLSMIIAFLFSQIKPNLLEKHSLKVYAIRFSAAAVMILAAFQLSN